MRRSSRLAWIGLSVLALAGAACAGAGQEAHRIPHDCGLATGDWCRAPSGDPCGRHPDEQACRADPRCAGMPYRGESLVACKPDGTGFWSNCPTMGCVSRQAKEDPR